MLVSANLLVELCLLDRLGEETEGRLFIGEVLIARPVTCRVCDLDWSTLIALWRNPFLALENCLCNIRADTDPWLSLLS